MVQVMLTLDGIRAPDGGETPSNVRAARKAGVLSERSSSSTGWRTARLREVGDKLMEVVCSARQQAWSRVRRASGGW